MKALLALIQGFAAWMGWTQRRQELNNTPEMVRRDEVRRENEAQETERKSVEKQDTESIRKQLGDVGKILLVCLALLVVQGCASTVAPKPVVAGVASFDGNHADSGFLGWADDGQGLITDRLRQKYDILVVKYADRWTPPLRLGEGIQPGPVDPERGKTWLITKESLAKLLTMTRWQREGR